MSAMESNNCFSTDRSTRNCETSSAARFAMLLVSAFSASRSILVFRARRWAGGGGGSGGDDACISLVSVGFGSGGNGGVDSGLGFGGIVVVVSGGGVTCGGGSGGGGGDTDMEHSVLVGIILGLQILDCCTACG